MVTALPGPTTVASIPRGASSPSFKADTECGVKWRPSPVAVNDASRSLLSRGRTSDAACSSRIRKAPEAAGAERVVLPILTVLRNTPITQRLKPSLVNVLGQRVARRGFSRVKQGLTEEEDVRC
jgi:hypothetical protein